MAFLASAIMALSLFQATPAADVTPQDTPPAAESRGNIFTRWLPGKRKVTSEAAQSRDDAQTPEKRGNILTRWLPGKREGAPEAAASSADSEQKTDDVRVRGFRSWKQMFPDKKQKPLSEYHGDKIKTQRWSSGQWIIEVRRDGFADGTQCYLRTREMIGKSRIHYADGVLGFRFKHHVDPNKVWFRVDDRPSKSWRAVFRDLHMLGLTVKPYASDYRDESVILIPADEMAGAQQIAIRPEEEGKPEKFDIAGFEEAMAASKRVGCETYVREDF